MNQLKKILYIKIASMIIVFMLSLNLAFSQNNFNLEVDVAENDKTAIPGEKVHFTTKILNLANQGRMDITLTYEISGSGQVIASKSETVAIETQASFIGDLQIPKETPVGDYNLIVKLLVNNIEEASGKYSFTIVKPKRNFQIYVIYILIAIIATIILYLLIRGIKKLIDNRKVKSKIHKIVKFKLNK